MRRGGMRRGSMRHGGTATWRRGGGAYAEDQLLHLAIGLKRYVAAGAELLEEEAALERFLSELYHAADVGVPGREPLRLAVRGQSRVELTQLKESFTLAKVGLVPIWLDARALGGGGERGGGIALLERHQRKV